MLNISEENLNLFAGQKSFMMGDTPSEVDCSVFGMLVMIVWQMKGSRHEVFVHGGFLLCEGVKI